MTVAERSSSLLAHVGLHGMSAELTLNSSDQ